METTFKCIKDMIAEQLQDPQAIRMADDTTFVYRFCLTPETATALSLPADLPFADITLDLMMEFMTVIGLNAQGDKVADGTYPTEVKGPFIRRIFDLYGEKVRQEKAAVPSGQEESLSTFFQKESRKTVRRFYLNYPAKVKDDSPLHLYIETEVDEDDPSYLNYWIGCEEHTVKRYIASCQADLEQSTPLEITKVKHLTAYLEELQK